MVDAETITNRYAALREKLDEASAKWGRVDICAVTKTVDAEIVNLVYPLGVRDIGENRVQEAIGKFPALNPLFRLNIIGQLQTNKVKYIADIVAMIQSLDRPALAEEISRRATLAGRVIPALIQVNIAKEPQKSGVYEESLPELLLCCSKLEGISVKGLMAIMPLVSDPEDVRPLFRRMRALFDKLRDEAPAGVSMEVLSMGMSGDCVVAAQEGATMVRVGSALFGKRA